MNSVRELIESAVDCLDMPLLVFNQAGSCSYLNKAAKELISFQDPQTEAVLCSDFWPDFNPSALGEEKHNVNFVALDGRKVKVLLRVFKLSESDYAAIVIAKASDGADSADLHNQRVETLGILAGGIAHDFNNILAGILGHITYLKTVLPEEGKHIESLNAIEEGSRKAAQLTKEILNYSRLEDTDIVQSIDPKDVVNRSCALLKGAFPPSIDLSITEVPQALQILGDEAKLSQVLVNLIINAKDALGNSGEISVAIDSLKVCDEIRDAFKGGDLTGSEYAVISVKDTGSGIAPDHLERIFEAYYSTKGNLGTGIGLATVKAIVTEFGGAITVQSEVGVGTEFRVYLPNVLQAAASEESQKVEEPQPVVGGSERILVVDDEAPVRNILSRSLEHLGYQVTSSASGNEAIDLFARNEGFDLVILDMLMPAVSGEEVFEKLLEIDPGVKVLIISGFASKESVQRILDGGGKGFLQKPFTIEQLSAAVREAL